MALTFLIIFLIIAVILLIAISLAVGLFAGAYAKRRPPFSIGIMDYSPLEFKLSPRPVYIKHSPKYGFYSQKLDSGPLEAGKIRVVLKSGWFGMIQRDQVWENNSLVIPDDKKRGWGTYKAELMLEGLKQKYDKQAFDLMKLKLRNSDLERSVAILSANRREAISDQVNRELEGVKKLLPPAMPKKNTGAR